MSAWGQSWVCMAHHIHVNQLNLFWTVQHIHMLYQTWDEMLSAYCTVNNIEGV